MNQLRTYDHAELFATGIGDVAQYAAFPRLDDASQPLEERARTYLDVNIQDGIPGTVDAYCQ